VPRHVSGFGSRWPRVDTALRVPQVREPAVVAGVCLIAYVALTSLLLGLDGNFWLDRHVQLFTLHHRTAGEIRVGRALIDLLSPNVMATAAITFGLGVSWARRIWRPIVLAASGVALIALTANGIRLATGRGLTYLRNPEFARPGAGTYPSGHLTMVVGAFLLVLIIVMPELNRRQCRQALGTAVGLWVVVSVALTVIDSHWITDDIAAVLHVGALIGAVAALDAWWEWRTRGSVQRPSMRGESHHRRADRSPGFAPGTTH
jgi:hypothetical protein